jgi:diguanylate cyclase (GGDEF)-like protein/PAS domain S-box-containing protein
MQGFRDARRDDFACGMTKELIRRDRDRTSGRLRREDALIELNRDRLSDLIGMIEEAGQVGYWELRADTNCFSWSPQIYRIHGRLPAENGAIPRHEALSFIHAEDRTMLDGCFRAAAEAGADFQREVRIIRPDGSVRHARIAGRPAGPQDGHADVFGILIDVTEFRRKENKLRRLADTDPLTGAVNVRRFEALAQAELRRVARFGKTASLVMIDIDGFKGINDTFGHVVGDDVLRQFVRTMVRALREVDIVARIGGDEFAILMPETSVEDAAVPLERIAMLSRTLGIERENLTICLTFSSGISPMTPAMDLREILRTADTLVYQAKREGNSSPAAHDGAAQAGAPA